MPPARKKGRRLPTIIARLKKAYPDATLALHFSSPFELLIALILAAQCTDERVNQVTGAFLFRKYRRPEDYVRVPAAELEADIRPTGFYRNKTKAIQRCCQQLVERFGGEVPSAFDDLIRLPGVGRKTANIVLGNAFGQAAIGVDTHVMRLSQRLGLSKHTDPDKIEADLVRVVPETERTHFCHLLQAHGRRVCVARKPQCAACVIDDCCPYPDKTPAATAPRPRPAFGRKTTDIGRKTTGNRPLR
jgi:endonuclease-3